MPVISHQEPVSSPTNTRLTTTYNKVPVNKQVVNNVGKTNAIKNDGLVTCRNSQSPTVTLHSSPSVVVTTVPHVPEAQQLQGSHDELFPWSSQPLPDNSQVTTYSVDTGAERTEALQNGKSSVEEQNHLTYPLTNQEVEQYVQVQDNILLEDVEIIESLNIGDDEIIVSTGMVGNGTQSVCVAENLNQLTEIPESASARVEGLEPPDAGVLQGTTHSQYVDQLLHHNVMVTNEQNTVTTQGNSQPPPPVNMGVVHKVASTLQA